jgi:hypothetical protein
MHLVSVHATLSMSLLGLHGTFAGNAKAQPLLLGPGA